MPGRLVRNPNLVGYWVGRRFVVEDYVGRKRAFASPKAAEVLDAFSEPLSAEQYSERSGFEPKSVRREVGRLVRLGFLVPAGSRPRGSTGVAARWQGALAAAHCHFARRDYVPGREEEPAEARVSVRPARPPSFFKDYPGRPAIALPDVPPVRPVALSEALARRRTVFRFTRRRVSWEDFAGVVRGTFGATGRIESGGRRLFRKSSPSAGARHPIECYVVASNVEKLPPGLYHFATRRNALVRLRRGQLMAKVVAATVGQRQLGNAAFVCILTAVMARVFYAHAHSDAYRNVFLDAGHLAQTFQLLCAERGVGPCITNLLLDSRLERFLGIDGVSEIPVLILGAGVTAA